MVATQEVQECALNRRRATQEPAEDLLNDTVIKNWMPWLFDAMVGPDADPDVKRMALEAGDKANINQIYSAGASKQQWDAFVTEDRIRQILSMDQRQSGQGYWRHAAAALGWRHDADRSRDRMQPVHARMVVPQRDVRPGGRWHRVR
jgi:hypothetical protein